MEIKFTCDYLDNICGSANLKFTVEIPQAILATFYWADEQGKELEDYLAIKSIPLFEGKGEYTVNKNLLIPENAKKIRCRVFKDTMKEIELPELVIDIPVEKQWKPKGKLLKKYVAASDIHGGGNYFNNKANRQTAIERIRDLKPDGVFISGDIANNAGSAEYDATYDMVDTYLKDVPVYISAGNHDYHPYENGAVANIEKMEEFFGAISERNTRLGEKSSKPSLRNEYDGTVSGAQVLVLNPCREDDRPFYGEEQLKWIDQKLTETDGERYRFLVTHFHQKNTVGLSPERMGQGFVQDDEALQEILNKHKNIIHMSGHTHYDFDSEGVNTKFDANNNNLYINGGCLVWCGVEFNQRREYYVKDRCTCQVIEVYEDCMVIRGLECVSGKYVARCIHRADF